MYPNRIFPYLRNNNQVDYLQQRELNATLVSSWNPFVYHGISNSKNFYRKNLLAHFGCVNAIEFSQDGKWLVSGGDDRRILLWNVQKAIHGSRHQPIPMQAEHASNIFAIACDRSNSKIYSGGNDDQVIVHDIQTMVPLDCFMHEQPVFGISVDPLNDSIFATACDSGRVCIYDVRDSSADPFCLASSTSAFHAVMFSPTEPRLVVTANSKKGVALFDVRHPKKCLLKYGGNNSDQCCMSAKFSSDGRRIFALRRRLPPVLYSTDSTTHLYQFNHMGYYNSCTMKSCSFAGENDEFVLSGSDNFDLYVWKIPSPEPPLKSHQRFVQSAHLVLKGHRSIVNQVRYNSTYSIIASSGVEKLIKLFSPFPLPSSQQGRSFWELPNEKERRIYSHDDYINLVMQSGQFSSLTFDTSRRNTKEDPRMMAFFDALIQRDIEGMDEDDELTRQQVSYTNTAFSLSSMFSDESRSVVESNTESDNTSSSTSLIEGNDYDNIQIVQSPRLITDHSSNEDDVIPINIVREDLTREDDNSIELELVPNESVSNETVVVRERTRTSLTSNSNRPNSEESNEDDTGTGVTRLRHNRNSNDNNITPPDQYDDEPEANVYKKREDNVITQMISNRQEQLLNMARTHVRLEIEGRQARRRREREAKLPKKKSSAVMTTGTIILPTSSSSSSSLSSSSSSDSSSDSDSKQLSKLRKKIRPLLWRKNKKILSSTSSGSADESTPNVNPKRKKPLKLNTTPVTNKKYGASQETLTKLKIYLSSLRDSTSAKSPPRELTPTESNSNLNSNEPCTSASVLLRDAIAAGLSQSNVLYDNKSNDSSSLSSTSTSSTSSSDSALERLVTKKINPRHKPTEENRKPVSEDKLKSGVKDGEASTHNDISTAKTHSSDEKRHGRKRVLSNDKRESKPFVGLGVSGVHYSDDDDDIENLLPAKKYFKTNKKRKTSDGSSDLESSLPNNKVSSSASLATPDSGIESSKNEQDGHFRRKNKASDSNSTSSSSSLIVDVLPSTSTHITQFQDNDVNNQSRNSDTSFKKRDKKVQNRNYRQHRENGE